MLKFSIFFFAVLAAIAAASSEDKILPSDIEYLFLDSSRMTTAHRTAPVYQMQCLDGCTQTLYMKQASCRNTHYHILGDPIWKCSGYLPTGSYLGSFTINCEGYTSEHDQYVTVGSCQMRYSVIPPKRVLFSEVESIYMWQGSYTTCHRENPIPQLQRLGGSAPSSITVSSAVCRNTNYHTIGDPYWECTVVLPDGYHLGSFSISVEGYDYKSDPYVTDGSWGMMYNVEASHPLSLGTIIIIIAVVIVLASCGGGFCWCRRRGVVGYSSMEGGGGFFSGFHLSSNVGGTSRR